MTREERIKENSKIFKNFMEKIRNRSNDIKKTDIKKHHRINRDENIQDDNSNEEKYHFKHGKPGEFFKEKINQRKEIEKQQIKKGIKINKPWEKKYDTEKKELNNNEIKQHKSIKPEWFLHKIEKQKEEKENSNTSLETFESDYKSFINSLKNEEK